MAGMRDDSAGTYGQWINPQDQSWGDYLKMLGMDAGEGAYNLLANTAGALSPVGTSPEGNMSLQVPPMVTGLVDSARRIGQSPGFTRVPEFDAQLEQDLANGLLSIYGGNALAGLAKPRGALGAGAMRDAGGLSIEKIPPGASNVDSLFADLPGYTARVDGKDAGHFFYEPLPNAAMVREASVRPEFQGQGIASQVYGRIQDDLGVPMTPDISLTQDGYNFWKKSYPEAVKNYTLEGDKWRPSGAHGNLSAAYEYNRKNGVPDWRMSGGPNRPDSVLWSDTVPLPPQQQDDNLPPWLKF